MKKIFSAIAFIMLLAGSAYAQGGGHGNGNGGNSPGSGSHPYNPGRYYGYHLGGTVPAPLRTAIVTEAYGFLINPPGPVALSVADLIAAYLDGKIFTIEFVEYSAETLKFRVRKLSGGEIITVIEGTF
jgi:hypothetical protein